MSLRPVIFLSAVSKELKTARQAAANTLTALGYTPDWQDIFGFEAGDLPSMLRRKVDAASAVIQIVGKCYGAEPSSPTTEFGRVSYTQYEALYAHSIGKPVHYLFTGPNYPADEHDPEPPELTDLQQFYIQQIKLANHLRHPATSPAELENKILRLRDDLTRLRRRTLQWAAVALIALFASAAGIAVLLKGQSRQEEWLDAQEDRDTQLLTAMRQLPAALAETQSGRSDARPGDTMPAAYAALEKKLQLPAGLLQSDLSPFAGRLLQVPDAAPLDRASALLARKQYVEAETEALTAKSEALRRHPPDTATAIEALMTAGTAALEQIHYQRALDHYNAAAALTNLETSPARWADVQYHKARTLAFSRKDTLAEELIKTVLELRRRVLGPEHPDTLKSQNLLGSIYSDQEKNEEAEAEHRAVLALRMRVLGPEHPDTLLSRNNLAEALRAQGQYAAAEAEHRAVLALRERVLGPEHLDTLRSWNNLAISLRAQGKYAEAEAEHRARIAIEQRVLGPEHPDTLGSRNNLAAALQPQKKYRQAEEELRAVVVVRDRVLGPTHPDSLMSHYNLALCLERQGDEKAEAKEHKQAQQLWEEALSHAQVSQQSGERVLGKEHPHQYAYEAEVEDLQEKLRSLSEEK